MNLLIVLIEVGADIVYVDGEWKQVIRKLGKKKVRYPSLLSIGVSLERRWRGKLLTCWLEE